MLMHDTGREQPVDPLPESFPSLEAAAEFWDTHELADYWEYTRPVEIDVRIEKSTHLVPLDEPLHRKLASAARKCGISAEALANLWIREKLKTEAKR
jgi:hypothetical protein